MKRKKKMKKIFGLILVFTCMTGFIQGSSTMNRVRSLNITLDFASIPEAPASIPLWIPPANGKAFRVVGWYALDDEIFTRIEAIPGAWTEGEVGDYYQWQTGGDSYYFIIGDGTDLDAVFQGPWWGNSDLSQSFTEGVPLPLGRNGYTLNFYPYNPDHIVVGNLYGLHVFRTSNGAYSPSGLLWDLDDGNLHGGGWINPPTMSPDLEKEYVRYTHNNPLVIQRVHTESVSSGSPTGSISIVLQVAVLSQ